MNKVSFKLSFILVLVSMNSFFAAQEEQSHADTEREIIGLINQVRQQVLPLSMKYDRIERLLLNADGEPIVLLPDLFCSYNWQIPLDSGLQKFSGSSLERIVPYVLRRLGALPTPKDLVLAEYTATGLIYYRWTLASDNMLLHTMWRESECRNYNGEEYQCRKGRIVGQNDEEVAKGMSFDEYALDQNKHQRRNWIPGRIRR